MATQNIQVNFERALELLDDTVAFKGRFYKALCNQAVFDIVNNQKVVTDIDNQRADNAELVMSEQQLTYYDNCAIKVEQACMVLKIAYLQASFGQYSLNPDFFVSLACTVPNELSVTEKQEVQAQYRNALKTLPKDYKFKPTLEEYEQDALQKKRANASRYRNMGPVLTDFCNVQIDLAKSFAGEFYTDLVPNDRHLLRIINKGLETVRKETLNMLGNRNPNIQADVMIMHEFANLLDPLSAQLEQQIENTANEPFGEIGNAMH